MIKGACVINCVGESDTSGASAYSKMNMHFFKLAIQLNCYLSFQLDNLEDFSKIFHTHHCQIFTINVHFRTFYLLTITSVYFKCNINNHGQPSSLVTVRAFFRTREDTLKIINSIYYQFFYRRQFLDIITKIDAHIFQKHHQGVLHK